LAGSTFGFFLPNPPPATNTCRYPAVSETISKWLGDDNTAKETGSIFALSGNCACNASGIAAVAYEKKAPCETSFPPLSRLGWFLFLLDIQST
jgi:hypothetical protein